MLVPKSSDAAYKYNFDHATDRKGNFPFLLLNQAALVLLPWLGHIKEKEHVPAICYRPNSSSALLAIRLIIAVH